MPRLLTGLSVVIVVLIAACGGGDDDASSSNEQVSQAQPAPIESGDDQAAPADGAATPEATDGEPLNIESLGEYGAALLAIMDEVQLEIDALDAQFEGAFSQEELTTDIFEHGLPAALSSVFDRLFAAISEFSPEADRSISRGITQIQALDPPGQFEADHELFVAGLIRDRDLRRKVQGAADNGVASVLFAAAQEADNLEDELEAALSAEFLVFVEPFFDEDEDAEPNGESSALFGEGGPDLTTVPDGLTIPGTIVEIAFNIPVNGGNSVFAILFTNASSAEILYFYEAALPAFGIAGDIQRVDAGDFPALLIGRDERSAALLISDVEDPTSITLGYFVAD